MVPLNARRRLAQVIATVGGIGYAPRAPGTFGTAAAIPLAYAGGHISAPWFIAATVLICVVGVWASTVVDRSADTHDAGHIVIDEVAGYLVTVSVVDRTSAFWLLFAFVLFRLLDIAKPFPIRAIDRHVKGGFGVMADDLAAGLVGAALLYAAQRIDWSRLGL
jgi:phosphatidylglycerophosphatase A